MGLLGSQRPAVILHKAALTGVEGDRKGHCNPRECLIQAHQEMEHSSPARGAK
jgi:hypothetical protein